jgi:hypothetical protein
MKSPTEQYTKLKRSLRVAERLIDGLDPIEIKSELEIMKVKSYVLICHSAFEQYIEDVCLEAAKKARVLYKHKGKITKTLVSLIASKVISDVSDKANRKLSAELASNIEIFSSEAFNRYRDIVNTNNGVTIRDLNQLLIPVGVDPSNTDVALMNTLDAFGKTRGDFAHKFTAQKLYTPTAALNDVRTIAEGIKVFDQAVCRNLRLQMDKTLLSTP